MPALKTVEPFGIIRGFPFMPDSLCVIRVFYLDYSGTLNAYL